MNTEPRFTEDEIAQMNREAMQIYHAENLALAERVKELELVCGALIDYFQPQYSQVTGGLGLNGIGYKPESHPLYVIFTRIMKLLNE